jgi:hypothetical protein
MFPPYALALDILKSGVEGRLYRAEVEAKAGEIAFLLIKAG